MQLLKTKRGSNQYKRRYLDNWQYNLAWYTVFIIFVVLFFYTEPRIISANPRVTSNLDVQAQVITTLNPSPTPSEKEQIIAYITRKWESHGTDEVVRAINCFYSESGLRADAYNENNNGSNDAGVAQINSIHGLSVGERMDWKTNIDKAYEIYVSRGNWSAWYGKACN